MITMVQIRGVGSQNWGTSLGERLGFLQGPGVVFFGRLQKGEFQGLSYAYQPAKSIEKSRIPIETSSYWI